VLLTLVSLAPQSPPALPELALDTFPPAARAAVVAALKKAVAAPDDAVLVGDFGRVLHAWEQWDAADRAYARAHALAPGAFEWPYLGAIVRQRLARHGEAAELLKKAAALRPSYLPARVKLAEALLEAGDTGSSRPLFEKLLAEPAAAPAAQLGLGRIAALEGQHDVAIAHFQRAISLFPEFGAAHYALARSYRLTGRSEAAAAALKKHAEYGPRWPGLEDAVLASVTALREDPRALLAQGIARAGANDVREAIRLHEAALAGDPSLVQAHANLLSLYGREQDWEKAEAHYRAALAAGVATADVHYDYGVVQGLLKNWDAAERAYRAALEINPLHANARNNLGQLFERRLDSSASAEQVRSALTEAAAQYRHAVEAQPSFRLGRFNLGRMLLALGQPEQAALEFDKLRHPVDAETPRYLFALSTARVRSGNVAEGITLATDARRLALEYGQTQLADAIARELAKLK
jgi:tetratricopeptide (TPR) repeat protein